MLGVRFLDVDFMRINLAFEAQTVFEQSALGIAAQCDHTGHRPMEEYRVVGSIRPASLHGGRALVCVGRVRGKLVRND
jgi:hypothetical protein